MGHETFVSFTKKIVTVVFEYFFFLHVAKSTSFLCVRLQAFL